jgi:hypothetical protein
MVHWPTIEAMEEEYTKNLEHYIKEHPKEFVLFEGEPKDLKATFYKTREEVDEVVRKKGPFSESSYLVKDIPAKSHRFNRSNKMKESVDTFVEVCGNDGETALLPQGITIDWNNGNPVFTEKAICPDCGYVVIRKPTEENIKRLGAQFNRVVSS